MKAVIYASNIRAGGAIGGAANLLDSLADLYSTTHMNWADEWHLYVSLEIAAEMQRLDDLRVLGVLVTERTDSSDWRTIARRRLPWADVRLVLRGPDHVGRMARREILGFADRSIITPVPRQLPVVDRLIAATRNAVKRKLLFGYEAFLTQTEQMARSLREIAPGRPVWVFPNSPATIFLTESVPPGPRSVGLPTKVRLFYPARGYPHKNHRLIALTADILREDHGIDLEVLCSLRPSEMRQLGLENTQSIIGVGELSRRECLERYLSCDGVFFPSLNETSSVTPLEGMALGLPVFASRLDFIVDVSGPAPFYFDPTDPRDAADTVARYFANPSGHSSQLRAGVDFVRALPDQIETTKGHLRAMREVSAD